MKTRVAALLFVFVTVPTVARADELTAKEVFSRENIVALMSTGS